MATVTPDRLLETLDERPDVVVLDAEDRLADALRLSNAARARRPNATVLLVGEGAAERAPAGLRIYHKWDETDAMLEAVAVALETPGAGSPPTALESG